jgi:cyclopropane-fatty-acyl-phospholipid synthase
MNIHAQAHDTKTRVIADIEASSYPQSVKRALKFATLIEIGTLDIRMPDGRTFRVPGGEPGPFAELVIHDFAFAAKMARGDVGVAESYLAGDWESPDLSKFLELFCANQPVLARLLEGRPVLRFIQMVYHWMHSNTKRGSRKNIHAHYDLGNAFYKEWLDPSMTYSSGLDFDRDQDLKASQHRKNAALAQALGIKRGDRVLEIGCGWGGFAEYAAAEVGAHVTGLTISKAQFDFARERIAKAGLSDKVDFKLQDYRDERGTYDHIVSIEMFEAVGEAYWPAYFNQLQSCLKPGGKAGVQVITIREDIFPRYRREMDFIRRYIFPGGMLPTVTILEQLAEKHGLSLDGARAFGHDYAQTLATWRDRFHAAWGRIAPLGFDDRFQRLWTYYLSYCEAGFRAGSIDVRQMVFAKG